MYHASTRTFSLPITVEFEDIDSYNIVHNTRIIDYLERARVHFLTGVIGLDLYPRDTGIVVYNLEIRFNKAARLMDQLKASVFVASMDDYRLELAYRLYRDREVLARATSGIAFMDMASGSLIAAPDVYRQKIAPYITGKQSSKTFTEK